MKKQNILKKVIITILIIITVICTSVFLGVHYLENRTSSLPGNTGSGEVISVDERPNQSEDGYYHIRVENRNGIEPITYEIDATGYMNTPLSPESQGETCLDIPKVKVGDRVSFSLPGSAADIRIFFTCFNKDIKGFYFKVTSS